MSLLHRYILTGVVTVGILLCGADVAGASTEGLEFLSPSFNGSGNPSFPEGFSQPYGVTVDQANGNIYVADNDASHESPPVHEVVDVLSPSGHFLSSLQCALCSATPPAGYERSIAFDEATGEAYVADSAIDSVVPFNTNGEEQAPWPAEYGGGVVYVAVDNHPIGDPADPAAGDVYVAASSLKVVDLRDAGGAKVNFEDSEPYINGSELLGTPASEGSAEPFTAFRGPQDIVVDKTNGDLYVDDGDHVYVFAPSGEYLRELSGAPISESALGLAVDGASDEAYVVDPGEAVLDAFDASSGVFRYQVEGTTPSEPFTAPLGVGVDEATGEVYVSDDKVVDAFKPLLPPAKPSATTGDVSSVSPLAAIVTGEVNPDRLPTTYRYQYGTSTAYGELSPSASAGAGDGAAPTSATLDDLFADTLYHYRLVATNDLGTSYGEDGTFTTSAGFAPTAVTSGAAGVTADTATVAGAIETDGLPTNYEFELGTEPQSYASVGNSYVGPGFGEVRVSLALQNLEPGTTYHYRLMASNLYATSVGGDQSFTTPGIPSPLSQPATAPLIATPSVAFPSEPHRTVSTPKKTLTRAQELAKAIKACKKDVSHRRRRACEEQARRRYGAVRKPAKA
jgi:DNA-binding beta-propeller fold protein YncE